MSNHTDQPKILSASKQDLLKRTGPVVLPTSLNNAHVAVATSKGISIELEIPNSGETIIVTNLPRVSADLSTIARSSPKLQPSAKPRFDIFAPLCTTNYCALHLQLGYWDREIQESEQIFIKQATETIRRDMLINQQADALVLLTNQVHVYKRALDTIESEYEFVNCMQIQLDQFLNEAENNFDNSVMQNCDERARLYNEIYANYLRKIHFTEDLESVIHMANECNSTGDKSAVEQIVRILDHHTNTLQTVDQKISLLETELRQLHSAQRRFSQDYCGNNLFH